MTRCLSCFKTARLGASVVELNGHTPVADLDSVHTHSGRQRCSWPSCDKVGSMTLCAWQTRSCAVCCGSVRE